MACTKLISCLFVYDIGLKPHGFETYFCFSLPADALLQWPKVSRQQAKLLLNFHKFEHREKGKV